MSERVRYFAMKSDCEWQKHPRWHKQKHKDNLYSLAMDGELDTTGLATNADTDVDAHRRAPVEMRRVNLVIVGFVVEMMNDYVGVGLMVRWW